MPMPAHSHGQLVKPACRSNTASTAHQTTSLATFFTTLQLLPAQQTSYYDTTRFCHTAINLRQLLLPAVRQTPNTRLISFNSCVIRPCCRKATSIRPLHSCCRAPCTRLLQPCPQAATGTAQAATATGTTATAPLPRLLPLYLSISPNTTSSVPITVTTSASI
jgi:hypothetical protein